MTSKHNKKAIAIVGPTASGKSELGVKLAKDFNGEIISADSRQVYKGLDVSSGKITPEEMKGIPHYMLGVIDPSDPDPLSLSEYLKLARVKIDEIYEKNKIPFIVGGTGLYVTALVEGYQVPEVEPKKKLREKLEKLSLEKLQDTYHAIDPEGFKKIDISNPRRLIRAIEVVMTTKKPFFSQRGKQDPGFETLVLGIKLPWQKLKENIHKRLIKRFQEGMLEEIKNLHKEGVSWERLEGFGLEPKWMTKLAKGEVEEKEALENLEKEIIAFTKRQMTWWRKRDVVWVKHYKEASEAVQSFLQKP